ncbi:homeobox-leucine zipper protein ATHB-8-like [Gastrolobium bilobum]|uniref:homeobox-leucine zipper protein ATHB-8-like n=1 Tax=Gastrolobium bilobum TaxID=150636 RepID=UPI002AB2E0C7|nr:homeobox-leucine zipper protein ATHB-8-like [Gastrolobium bilobum]
MKSLITDVPPEIFRLLREHWSEWEDSNIDAYSATVIKIGPCSLLGERAGSFGGEMIYSNEYNCAPCGQLKWYTFLLSFPKCNWLPKFALLRLHF